MSRSDSSRKIAVLQVATFLFLAALFFFLFVTSVESRSAGTSIPSDQGVLSGLPCSGCHSGSLSNGSVQFNDLPSSFVPGTTYDIGITMMGGSVYGFQLAAVFSDDTQAGTLAPMTSGVTTNTVSGVQILVHSSTLNSGTVNFQWSAPTDPKENAVIFKVAANSANGNFSSSGDSISTLQATVPQQTPPPELTERLLFAQFADGSGLSSEITLVNLSATEMVTGNIEILGDTG